MLDISQATNMLTSLGVSSSLAAKAAERTAQNQTGSDPLTFLKELQATLQDLSSQDIQGGASAASDPASASQTKPYQSTSNLYSGDVEDSATTKAAAKVPFSNLEEFRKWEQGLGDTFAADYKPPDYVRVLSLSLGAGEDRIGTRYMFFKNHPEFAADYESIRSGKLSKFPTDGSTLVKSDLSAMPAETAAFYKKNPAQLLAAEGFNMDPTLAQMRMAGKVDAPAGANTSEWLMDHKWTKDGVVEQNNRVVLARADYIGLDGKGAGTYRLGKYDNATGNIIGTDGRAYDPLTGEAQA